MAVISITGSQFTVSLAGTAYSAQVTGGTVTTTPTVSRTKTLTDTDYSLTDLLSEVSLDYLYDEETGMYGALETANLTGASVAVIIVGGDAKWTGTMYCTKNETKFAADAVASASCTLVGTLVLADQP